MNMDNPNEKHNRRVDDLIAQVKAIQQEAEDFMRGRAPKGVTKRQIMAKQTMAMSALRRAIELQQELLGQMADTGMPAFPQRRASDQPFESELKDIQVRAGIK